MHSFFRRPLSAADIKFRNPEMLMARIENLFVITSIVLLVAGISTPYLPMNTGWSIIVGKTSFGLAWETPLYGVAALCGVFACLYSIRYLPFNARFMQWHFWLSVGCVIW